MEDFSMAVVFFGDQVSFLCTLFSTLGSQDFLSFSSSNIILMLIWYERACVIFFQKLVAWVFIPLQW